MEDQDVDGRIFKWALEMEWECGDLTTLAEDRGKSPAGVSRLTKWALLASVRQL